MTNLDLYNSLMKNLIYILLGAGFLAIISSSASGFLTTETSNTLDNLYEETFYIDPENIEISNENVVITLSQQNKNNADKKINDCLNYYKKVYEDLDINCNLEVKENGYEGEIIAWNEFEKGLLDKYWKLILLERRVPD